MSCSSTRIVVAGSGRSGTTWVLDLLSAANKLKPIFEPLKECVGAASHRLQNRYFPAETDQPDAREFFDGVFAGTVDTVWTRYRIVPDRLIPRASTFMSRKQLALLYSYYRRLWRNARRLSQTDYDGIAVKMIRANLIIEWLVETYRVPTVFVVRHPCAVIESKMRLDGRAAQAQLMHGQGDWDPYAALQRYLEDDRLRARFLETRVPGLQARDLSEVEAHALLWCIENVPVLEMEDNPLICKVCYEHLISNDDTEWQRIVDGLGLAAPVEDSQVALPSEQASADFRQTLSRIDAAKRWQERMPESAKRQIAAVLDRFAFGLYTVVDPMPASAGF